MSAKPISRLSVTEHSRDASGMVYVYPVISRRAGGVSVGINLNPNNACNWRCIYCQVPDLTRGGPPPIDVARLRQELETLLDDILVGNFMQERVPEPVRRLVDVAFSGNGEPTSAKEFPAAMATVIEVLQQRKLLPELPIRLITNGSLLDRPAVQAGVAALGRAGGEVWFKVDAVTPDALRRTNNTRTSPSIIERRLRACAALAPTWLQSCFFVLDGKPPAVEDIDAYVEWVGAQCSVVAGVHLYGIARASMQPEAARLSALPADWFSLLAGRLEKKGLTVKVSP